ncbi:hypothetical protein [Bacteriovorax sp. DB6_IX]|uniref:hypothetical protein n=1 Tax=Bacteriovorax sp. DB6_IX TaxID=1353530 RepID=UPI00038A20F2|nr:hypothetical protein [Bacteriovorax sp. DB6_IX]EQC49717.1 hypothetical protein M901_1243 [Bacteriovorax sp. DB6_IX]
MKKLICLVALLLTAQAFGETVETYAEPTGFAVYYIQDEAECSESGGIWDSEVCLVQDENKLTLTKSEGTDSKVTKVNISTWGGNAHSCDFTSTNVYNVGTALKVVEPVEIYEFGSQEHKLGLCEVTLTKTETGYSVDNNGNCNYFCGMRAWLYIENATKK